jgi:hypothetical protein
VENSTLDQGLFPNPPPECKKQGGATFRINCNDDGFYNGGDGDSSSSIGAGGMDNIGGGSSIGASAQELTERDAERAERVVPGTAYKGETFGEMSAVLNAWLEKHPTGVATRPCESFNSSELQSLQALLFLARDARLDEVYQGAQDNRRILSSKRRRLSLDTQSASSSSGQVAADRGSDSKQQQQQQLLLEELQEDWAKLDAVLLQQDNEEDEVKEGSLKAGGGSNLMPIDAHAVHRDGHCHEAVMWFVHHLREDVQHLMANSGVEIPLLSPKRHGACQQEDTSATTAPKKSAAQKMACKAYEEQVSCASCHSQVTPP